MCRAAIHNEKGRSLGAGDQSFQEFDEYIGGDAAFLLDHEPHLAARGDR